MFQKDENIETIHNKNEWERRYSRISINIPGHPKKQSSHKQIPQNGHEKIESRKHVLCFAIKRAFIMKRPKAEKQL